MPSDSPIPERLLTYRAAADRMGISEKAFRDRVARGTIPDFVLASRSRGIGRRPERFVLGSAFDAWFVAPLEPPTEGKETAP